jgi:hypothetical protein
MKEDEEKPRSDYEQMEHSKKAIGKEKVHQIWCQS